MPKGLREGWLGGVGIAGVGVLSRTCGVGGGGVIVGGGVGVIEPDVGSKVGVEAGGAVAAMGGLISPLPVEPRSGITGKLEVGGGGIWGVGVGGAPADKIEFRSACPAGVGLVGLF